MKGHRTTSLSFLLLLLPLVSISVFASVPDDEDSKRYSRQIHVIVFELMNAKELLARNQSKVVALASADMPVRLSRAFVQHSSEAGFTFNDPGIPGELSVLDISTFKFSEKEINKAKKLWRENDFTDLHYSIKVRDWTDGSCAVEFGGSYGRNLPKVVAQLSRTTTTLIRVDRLCFAFTFMDAAINADETMRSTRFLDSKKNISYPKPIKRPLPNYPPELLRKGVHGHFCFLAVITQEGTVDKSSGIILECFHWLFARHTLSTIVNGWVCTPAQLDRKAISVMTEIEVGFQPWSLSPDSSSHY